MKNWDLEEFKEYGFKGFVKISELINNYNLIPEERGVYLILKSDTPMPFLKIGNGGYFKKKDPNVDIEILQQKWVENSQILYIGQAGGIRKGTWSNSTLRKRLKQYCKFGQGKAIGHLGGRYIWQLQNNQNLIVCWLSLPEKTIDPRGLENELICQFRFY